MELKRNSTLTSHKSSENLSEDGSRFCASILNRLVVTRDAIYEITNSRTEIAMKFLYGTGELCHVMQLSIHGQNAPYKTTYRGGN